MPCMCIYSQKDHPECKPEEGNYIVTFDFGECEIPMCEWCANTYWASRYRSSEYVNVQVEKEI